MICQQDNGIPLLSKIVTITTYLEDIMAYHHTTLLQTCQISDHR